jgi:hypothetical protein
VATDSFPHLLIGVLLVEIVLLLEVLREVTVLFTNSELFGERSERDLSVRLPGEYDPDPDRLSRVVDRARERVGSESS